MPAQTVIKLRRDTAANWNTANPVLGAGEPGLETDTGLVKYGDGTNTWSVLPYTVASTIRTKVLNQTGSPITKGSAVYINGANGDNPTIALADADTEATSSKTLGLVDATIANGAIGYVVEAGLITGLNTATATAGQSVWLSSTAGGFVYNNPPAKPANSVYLGVVVRAQTNNGAILVKVQNGYELNELHDVNAGSPSTGQVLQWNGTAWVNATVDALPSQSGNDGKYLTTNGTVASWANINVANVSDLTASAAELNILDGATLTTTELNYVDGVTSAIQTQLNGKAATSHTHGMTDLTAFEVTDPVTGQTLQYNGTKWVNATAAAGGETISSFLLMGA